MSDHVTRREFLGTGVAAGLMLSSGGLTYALASEAPMPQPRRKARICVIFTGAPGPADRGWNTDPGQMAAMNTSMPVMMLFFLYNMPSGRVIYWTINTAVTALQTWRIHKSAPASGGAPA